MRSEAKSASASLSGGSGGENKNPKIYLVIFVIVAILLLAGIIYWFWRGNEKTATTTLTPSVSASPSKSASPSADPYAGWKELNNSSYGYNIQYPATATLDAEILGCVTINTKYGHVIIKGKGYEEICGRTGVGSEYTELNETIAVQGKSYNSTGFKSLSLNPYDEFLMFTLDDGNAVDYGIDEFNKNSSNPTYETVKNEVKKIVESYE